MKVFLKQAMRYFPFWYILAIWGIHIYRVFGKDVNLSWMAYRPFQFKQWYTFLTGALSHSDWMHLANNTYPLAITGMFLFFLYGKKYSNFVFITTYFFTGLFFFLFARRSVPHHGASGVAYCWAFLLAFSGFFRKDRISLGLGLLVAMLYGSMIWGVLPIQKGVSWDGHLIGALTGIVFAWLYRNVNDQENQPVDEEEEKRKETEAYNSRRFQNSPYRYIQKQLEEEE